MGVDAQHPAFNLTGNPELARILMVLGERSPTATAAENAAAKK
jgi:hypothetical protein